MLTPLAKLVVLVLRKFLTEESNQMAKVRMTQIRSTIDRPENQKRTVRALGFTKLNQTIEVEATPQIQGMINKVSHLLKVENI